MCYYSYIPISNGYSGLGVRVDSHGPPPWAVGALLVALAAIGLAFAWALFRGDFQGSGGNAQVPPRQHLPAQAVPTRKSIPLGGSCTPGERVPVPGGTLVCR
jgi:hypothetical protein